MPVVSVIIPTRDRASLLQDAIASVRRLEGPDVTLEIIVVDNGSSDNTHDVALAAGARVIDEPLPGPSAARNAGMRAANGEYIAFLDDDDQWTPENLRPQLAFLTAHPDFAAVAGEVQMVTGDLSPIGTPYPDPPPGGGDMVRTFFRQHPQLGSLVARTTVRDTVGYFDSTIEISEDWDWCMRLALVHNVAFVPVTSVLFRQRPWGTHDDLQWNRFQSGGRVFWRNIWRAGSRRPSWPSLFRIWTKMRGGYFGYFVQSAIAHAHDGERSSSRACVVRAFRASPAHATYQLLLGGPMRTAVGLLLRGPRAAAEHHV